MKRTHWILGCFVVVGIIATTSVWGRGRGGGGGGGGARPGGGGGVSRPSGGGLPGGGGGGMARPSGGGGLSGGGFHPPSIQRPQTPSISRPSVNLGGGGAGAQRPNLGAGGGGVQRPNLGGGGSGVVHMPGQGGGGMQIGGRPQLGDGGAITRPDFAGGGPRPGLGSGGAQDRLPNAGTGAVRPGAGGAGERFPGLAGGDRPAAGGGATTLPGLGPRPGAGGAGERNPGLAGGGTERFPNAGQAGNRPGAGGAGTRFPPDSRPARHDNINNQFSQMQNNWGDGDWHSWTGPNGGQINHIGFWGPNGYWGHTGAWGPNGGHIGHTTGIGPNGAYGVTRGWGAGAGPAGYWSRGWGGWYNGYGPGWGNGRWDYLWNQYPVAMGFGCTMWGLNALAYGFGIGTYSNPYYDSSGSYPVAYDQPITGDPAYETADAENVDPATDPLTQKFDQARTAFQQNQFDQALQLTDEALKQAPRDAAINEFRSLCLFALGRYRESAAVIHSVLAAGPGWDWTTMVGLYSSSDVYTAQLRKLEAAASADPNSADTRFLLAYHYLTADHADAAVEMWKQVVQIQPGDKLAAELVQMYGPKEDVPPSAPTAAPPNLDKPAYTAEQLAGPWKAQADGGEFALTLDKDDTFTWSFTRDGKPQSVTGAYALGGNNLVMQPDSGGTMPATITLENPNTLVFTPIGDAEKLTFTK